MKLFQFSVSFGIFLPFFLAPLADAEEGDIIVLEILGVNTDDKVDPALPAKVANSIKKSPFGYKGYKLIKKHLARIGPGNQKSLRLSEGYILELLGGEKGGELKLACTLKRNGKVSLRSLSIIPGRSPTVLGGATKLKAGGMLLYIMMAR